MKQLVVFCALFVVCVTGLDPGLRVRYDVGVGVGSSYFYNVPRTTPAAVSEGWTQTERPSGPLEQLVLYCYSDKILCALYDDTDNVAGLQIAFPQDKYTGAIFDWQAIGYTEWVPTVAQGETVKYWTIQQYFISEESLRKSKEERLASRDSGKTLQEGGVWVTGFKGELTKISSRREDIENSIFTEQACVPGMGRHFYYNMSSELPCDSTTIYPWFSLVDSQELVALGLLSPGQLPVVDGERDWFERAPRQVVEAIVPRGPECLYDLATSPGVITMHIYFIDQPWLLDCLLY